jgi:hypothetical protein
MTCSEYFNFLFLVLRHFALPLLGYPLVASRNASQCTQCIPKHALPFPIASHSIASFPILSYPILYHSIRPWLGHPFAPTDLAGQDGKRAIPVYHHHWPAMFYMAPWCHGPPAWPRCTPAPPSLLPHSSSPPAQPSSLVLFLQLLVPLTAVSIHFLPSPS